MKDTMQRDLCRKIAEEQAMEDTLLSGLMDDSPDAAAAPKEKKHRPLWQAQLDFKTKQATNGGRVDGVKADISAEVKSVADEVEKLKDQMSASMATALADALDKCEKSEAAMLKARTEMDKKLAAKAQPISVTTPAADLWGGFSGLGV